MGQFSGFVLRAKDEEQLRLAEKSLAEDGARSMHISAGLLLITGVIKADADGMAKLSLLGIGCDFAMLSAHGDGGRDDALSTDEHFIGFDV